MTLDPYFWKPVWHTPTKKSWVPPPPGLLWALTDDMYVKLSMSDNEYFLLFDVFGHDRGLIRYNNIRLLEFWKHFIFWLVIMLYRLSSLCYKRVEPIGHYENIIIKTTRDGPISRFWFRSDFRGFTFDFFDIDDFFNFSCFIKT